MFTEAQRQYIEEVLGTSAEHYRAAAPAAEPAGVLVVTPALAGMEQALLLKILGSIQLTDFVQVEAVAENVQPQHVLWFHGEVCSRSADVEGRTTWNFPSVDAMAGSGPQVAALKKETWALLQQFQRERVR